MSLLLATSQANAQALADKAQAWLSANVARYAAEKWCAPIKHPKDGRWAIAFEDRFAPVFTAAELGTSTQKTVTGTALVRTKVLPRTDDWNPILVEPGLAKVI